MAESAGAARGAFSHGSGEVCEVTHFSTTMRKRIRFRLHPAAAAWGPGAAAAPNRLRSATQRLIKIKISTQLWTLGAGGPYTG